MFLFLWFKKKTKKKQHTLDNNFIFFFGTKND